MPNGLKKVNAFDYVFAVVGTEPGPSPESLRLREVCGTAFSIGGGLFVTANHVLESVSTHPECRLGYEVPGSMNAVLILESESLPSHDLAILRSPVGRAKAARWSRSQLNLLEDVQVVGFPYAHDVETREVKIRAFKGSVVSNGPFQRLPSRPGCYELSFQAPRGLSGAPLWTRTDPPFVVGHIVGNQSTEMLVFSSRERIVEEKESVVERFEAMQTGVAIQSSAVLGIDSRLCNGTIAGHLTRHALL